MDSNGKEYVESPGTGTGVMVSNLPLLFTRGFPSSLQLIKLDELEDFVPFMVRCSLGEENPVPWSQLPRPSWWPRKLPFRIPSASSSTAKRTALLNLVERCYSYHGCEYLLLFCASLVETMPPTGYRFNDNRDGTTSMYHGTTGKLLVTFRNENRDYDKSNHDVSLRKKLLLSPTRVSSSGTATAVFQAASTDIYLCDKCENEFYSLREVQIHEKNCCGDVPPSPIPPSPDPEPIDDEPEPAGQVPFLAYFKLQPAKHTGLKPYMSPRKRTSSPPRKAIGLTFPRFDSIPLTSPLGKFLLANSKFRNKYQASQHLIIRYERHLHATPHTDIMFSRERCNNRWIVVWRPNKEQQPWVHLYCFTKTQRQERRITIRTGLNWKSRRLLSKCRPLRVSVKRLQKRVIDRVTRRNDRAAPCIDLTDEPQKLFGNSMYPVACAQPGDILPASVSMGMSVNGTPKMDDPCAMKIVYETNEDPLSLGASSSSLLGSKSQLISVTVPSLTSKGHNEMQQAEVDPLSLSPGDIIEHDSISLFPIPHSEMRQNHFTESVNNDSNHVLQQFNRQYQKTVAPGPKCSKNVRVELIHSSSLQQINNSGMLNSGELRQLSNFNDGVHKVYKKLIDVSSTVGSGSSCSLSNHGEQNGSQNLGNVTRTHTKKSLSVPQVSESNNKMLSNKSGVNIISVPIEGKNSSIEVIDLSSDDDDTVRVRGFSEADINAPYNKLDGIACYPHPGAKVPGSSKISLPKNGNSHWSSTYKSHCDAGRVGDLATNGQPPNVLESSFAQPVPVSSLLPAYVAQPLVHQATEIKLNTRKRRCEDPVVAGSGGKLLVLDVSNQGLKVSSLKQTTDAGMHRFASSSQMSTPAAIISINSREIDDAQSIPILEATYPKGSNQLGALVDDSRYQSPSRAISENGSGKIQYRMQGELKDDERIHVKDSASKFAENSSGLFVHKSNNNSQELSTEKSVGLVDNIVGKVSKCLERFRSWMGTPVSDHIPVTSEGKLSGNSKVSYDVDNLYTSNTVKSKNVTLQKSTKVPKISYKSEVEKLLWDECWELTRCGLENVRRINLKNGKLTRRSVERIISSKAQRKHWRKNYQSDTDEEGSHKPRKEWSSESSVFCSLLPDMSDDLLSNCIDENGNSPSYLKTKVKVKLKRGAQNEISPGNVAKQTDNYMLTGASTHTNDNSVDQLFCSKSDKTCTDYYRSSIDLKNVTDAEILDNNHVSTVNTNPSTVGATGDVNLIKCVGIDAVPKEKYSMMKRRFANTEDCLYPTKTASLACGNYSLNKDVSVQSCIQPSSSDGGVCKNLELMYVDNLCNTSEIDVHPSDIYRLSSATNRASNYVMNSFQKSYCPAEFTGKTAEECGALQAKVPLEDELSSVESRSIGLLETKQSYPFQSTSTFYGKSGNEKSRNYAMSTLRLPRPKTSGSDVHLEMKNLRRTGEEKGNFKKGFHVSNSITTRNGLEDYSSSMILVVKDTKDCSLKTWNDSLSGGTEEIDVQSELFAKSKHKKKDKPKILKRELSNLGKDEWKEMRRRGFHPSLLVNEGGHCGSDSDNLEKETNDLDNMPLRKRLLMMNGKSRGRKRRDKCEHNRPVDDDETRECESLVLQTSNSIMQGVEGSATRDISHEYGRVSERDSFRSHWKNREEVDNQPCRNIARKIVSDREERKRSLLKEFNNLGKNEWKEMRKSGFHPSSTIGLDFGKVSYDETDEESKHDFVDNLSLSRRICEQKGPKTKLPHEFIDSDQTSNTCTKKHSKRKSCFDKSLIKPSIHEQEETPDAVVHDPEDENQDHWSNKRPWKIFLNKCWHKQHPVNTDINSNAEIDKSNVNENGKAVLKSKPKKKPSLSRELLNLGKDEWKEMRNTGFHPADLVGSKSDDISYFFGESEDEDDEDRDSNENKPPVKSSQVTLVQDRQGSKKLPREILLLLQDECKELKQKKIKAGKGPKRFKGHVTDFDSRSRDPRALEKLLSEALRTTNQYADSLQKSTGNDSKSLKDQQVGGRYTAARNTRSQTNVTSAVKLLTPRDSHRQLLHAETAMCVFNFDLPSIS